MSVDDEIEINQENLLERFEQKLPEDINKLYVIKKNPYEIPAPDYLFLLENIKKISEKRA